MIPDLNQTCGVYNYTLSRQGDKTPVLVAQNVVCRLVEGSQDVESALGEDVEYLGNVHLPEAPLVNKGQLILFKGTYYEIAKVTKTRNLKGSVLFQFAMLTQSSV